MPAHARLAEKSHDVRIRGYTNAINIRAAPAIFYWSAAQLMSKKPIKTAIFRHSESSASLKMGPKTENLPIWSRF
jgi:hypothetical protein